MSFLVDTYNWHVLAILLIIIDGKKLDVNYVCKLIKIHVPESLFIH